MLDIKEDIDINKIKDKKLKSTI